MRLPLEFAQDVKLGARRLRRDVTFSVVSLACLTLAIGGVTAVYSVIEPVLWRPLPFPDAERIHVLQSGFTAAGGGRQLYAYSGENYIVVRDEQTDFEAIGAWVPDQFLIGHGEDAVVVSGVSATAGVFDVLRTPPVAGRPYTAVEEMSEETVALISDGLWRRLFGGDPDIVRRRVSINGLETLVIGVLPSASAYPQGTDVWMPLQIDRWSSTELELGVLNVLARLRHDATPTTTAAMLSGLDRTLAERYPSRNIDRSSALTPLRTFLVGDLRAVMTGLLGAVTFLALIGGVNLGALLMARGRSLHRELMLRAILGAGPERIARQLLTETLMLCTVGGIGGVLTARVTVPGLLALAPQDLPAFAPITLGWNGAGLAASLVLVFTIVAGATPALFVTRTANAGLHTREITGARGVRRVNDVLIGLEIAVAMILLAAAGVLLLDVHRLTAVDPGVVSRDVATFRVRLPDEGYRDHEAIVTAFEQMLERVAAVPGVDQVGAVHRLPFGDGLMGWSFSVEGMPPVRVGGVEVALGRLVAGDYLNTVGVPILRGRGFEDREPMHALSVVVVSEALADRYWPGQDPIGKRIKRRGYDSDRPWLTVVGIAANVRDRGPGLPPQPVIYRPVSQAAESYANQLTIVARLGNVRVEPAALRAAVSGVDPFARVFDFEPYDAAVASVTGAAAFAAVLLSVFAGLGLIMAGAGVFGMTLYVVHRRLPEIGIRRALGATEQTILWETLRHGAAVAAGGVTAGMLGFATLRATIETRVAAVGWFEPSTLIPVALLLLLTAVAAAAVPACHAARVDPVSLFRR